MTDNGPLFASRILAFRSRVQLYGFTSTKSSPYRSQGNGRAESAVNISKNILKKSRHEDPYLALLAYRNTPQQGYDYSNAERLMSRKRRDIIPTATSQLVPELAYSGVVQENIAESSQKGKKVPSIPPHKLVSTMDLWGGSRTAQTKVFRGQNSNGTSSPQSLPNQESESRFS